MNSSRLERLRMLEKLALCIQIILSVSILALPQTGYLPHRVYDSGHKRFSDFEAMLAELSRSDVVFVGEQHNDQMTHHLELALLEGIARRKPSLIVALEMFERDTQSALDDYLAGRMSEADFLKASRPWPNYATDYRPLVELAKARGWRVVAGNVPRRYAAQVARSGLASLDSLPAEERALIARQIDCPRDDYFKRFAETMKDHPAGQQTVAEQEAMTERFYQSQCVKDETMAEAIASAAATDSRPLVVHFNGAFHSDYRLGAAERTKRRLPKSLIRVVSIVPAEDLDNLKTDELRKRGDFILFALKARKNDK